MKQAGGLYDQLCDRGNLVRALWNASRAKRDRPEVRALIDRGEQEINQIAAELAVEAYEFSPYHAFAVRDTKTRTIHAPCFRDRVVHHAMINVAGPILESGALYHSYACRQGKGQHAAVRQARQWTRRQLWYGKIDVRKFYDSVPHELLQRALSRRFSDSRLLKLFDRLLQSYETAPGHGLPIGALTSQYLGNFYLDQFDRKMKATRLVPRYLRYMDDIVIWSPQERLSEIRAVARDELSNLRLSMKNGGEWNRCVRGLPFLGYVIYPDRIRLNKNGRQRLRRKLHGLRRAYARNAIGEAEVQQRCTSLFAHASHADDVAWRRAVLSCFDSEEWC